jgi:ADP-heptose:LPS heptosyltransferase
MMKKILIIRFSSIGDIVLTSPVIRCLKKQLPSAEIHYATGKSFATIVETNPYVDKLHLLDKDLSAFIQVLKKEDFDYIIDLHHNIRSARIKWALKKPSSSFPKLNIEKWLYVRFKWNRMPNVHIVDRYMETVKTLGIKNDGNGLDYFIPDHDHVDLTKLPFQKYIGLVIGAAHTTKRLPIHKLMELINKLEHPIIVLGSKDDKAVGEKLAALAPDRIFNACGAYNLNQSASLVKQAALIITHDTGLMHIAAAFEKPILSVWGNTVSDFGMYPYLTNRDKIEVRAEVKGLSCRPCSKIGFKSCPKGHFNCMERQDIMEIVKSATEILSK